MTPNRREFGSWLAASLLRPGSKAPESSGDKSKPPNFIIFLCDDLGYGDLGCYGNEFIRTPNVDRLAAEGARLTEFYATPTCTPSRASLLTGRYPPRSGLTRVLVPQENFGIPTTELTLAGLLKKRGYRTACIGKWHLGDAPRYRPNRHGFDYFFGVLYSHDMVIPLVNWPPVKLFRNEMPIEAPARNRTMTRRLTEEAVQFICRDSDSPFFLYLPYTMPHVPWAASEDFAGKSKRGLYGDAVEEVDWSTGEVLGALSSRGLDENTVVIFCSDNGPDITTKRPGGSTGGLRGGKSTTWEGGVRVPCVIRWPGHVRPSTALPGISCLMDVFATIVEAAGAEIPQDHIIDGINLSEFLMGDSESPRSVYCHLWKGKLFAVRWNAWKAHFAKRIVGRKMSWPEPIPCDPPELYNLEEDPGETRDVSVDYAEIIWGLTKLRDDFQASMASGRVAPSVLRSLFPGRRKGRK